MTTTIFTPLRTFTLATLLRLTLLLWGLYQDAHSPLKYTDIDYYVFTDASRFLSHNLSPYARDTYRYTPLLAWLLYPTTFPAAGWFSFGKILFALSDLVAGWLIILILRGNGMSMTRALKFASIWLLNPMVATISTRGSSEGLLGVMVVALLWAITKGRVMVAGVLLGLSVHFKIYPFIYAGSIVWWMDASNLGLPVSKKRDELGLVGIVKEFCNAARIKLAVVSLGTFMGLNILMYSLYGFPFLQHTYLHHITRIDHRHNFSPYNTLLYLTSSQISSSSPTSSSNYNLESLAFIPQLLLSAFLLPFLLAKKDLPSTMLAQTFAFVSFNKVCTSQYFLWYTIFLPFYLPTSTLLHSPQKGILAAALWVAAQAAWLHQGFELEFLGKSTFVPGLWGAGVGLFAVNCWILGIVVGDVGGGVGKEGEVLVGEGSGKIGQTGK